MKKYVSLGIMMTLYSGKRYTAPELAEKYETSVKTIYRAIDNLLEAGMPIRCIAGKGGGYEIIKESKIDTSFFTMSELSSFVSFLKSTETGVLNENTSSIDERLSSINDKSFKEDIMSESQHLVIDTQSWGACSPRSLLVENIKQSITTSKKIEIEYNSRFSCLEKRKVHPYTLVYKADVWYLYAYCETRKAFRLFKLSRIKELNLLNETYQKQNIDTLSKPWNKEFEDNLERMEIMLACDKKIMPEISEWLGTNVEISSNKECNQITSTKGNSCVVKAYANYSKGLVHRLMLFGEHIKILSPNKLKTSLVDECQKICNGYS